MDHQKQTRSNPQEPSEDEKKLEAWLPKFRIFPHICARKRSTAVEDSSVRRLGKAELGPYAYEERMPIWLCDQLDTGSTVSKTMCSSNNSKMFPISMPCNETTQIINMLSKLCTQDSSVEAAYLCHPGVQYISKTKREGNFCGYRNIQMLVSYILCTEPEGHNMFMGKMPSVLVLQQLIEDAWDKGFNSDSRVETGGVIGTRKYVGTPEAQAVFLSLNIPCKVAAYHSTIDRHEAWESLLHSILHYFLSSPVSLGDTRIHQTKLPPIYLQRPSHSLTIIGFEQRTNGSTNLLVFDPAYSPTSKMRKAVECIETDVDLKLKHTKMMLRPYRRGNRQLQRYKDFETLVLTGSLLRDRGFDG